MSVNLLFGCGGVLTCDRSALSVSDVLEGALDAAASNQHAEYTVTIPMLHDAVEEWKLALPFCTAARGGAGPQLEPKVDHDSACSSNSCCSSPALDFPTAAVVLKIADKYSMKAVSDMVEAFLKSEDAVYSQAPVASGDQSSIWRWLQISSTLTQPSLLQYYRQRIVTERLVPNSTADVAGLHPSDLAELLVAFMQANAQVRYKCLGCAGRNSTEVKLCGRCSFSPHLRV